MANTNDVLTRLLSTLSLSDPTWDTSVGTATYKILESVAQEIANASNNSTLQTYSYNINTKFGAELDSFVNLFGLYRQLGTRATGTVTFSLPNGSSTNTLYPIPLGTQVAVPIGNGYSTAIYFATTAPAVIPSDSNYVEIPVSAVIPGSQGNVPAGAVTNLISTLVGITTVINSNPISGGADPETDSQLRGRWNNTVFNNNLGTNGKYIVTALQNSNVSQATSLGPQQYLSEQLQVSGTLSNTGGTPTTLTFNFVAYSGMTVGNTTYNATTNVSSSGITVAGLTPASLQSSLNTMISGALNTVSATTSGINFTVSGTLATLSGGTFTITSNIACPYDLTMSGTTNATTGITTSGGTTYYQSITSNNPDIVYNLYGATYSGYLFPQGGELVGQYLGTNNQIVYSNGTDYIFPSSPSIQLALNIYNGSHNPAEFIGNTIQLNSEYTSAASRASATMPTVSNYADIFINGTTPSTVTEQVIFNPSATLSGQNTAQTASNYILASGINATTTASGDYYIPLTQQPVINFPSQLTTSNSGVADYVYIWNTTINSGINYPITVNYYNVGTGTSPVVFSGTLVSGTNFIRCTSGSSIPTGLTLPSGSGIPAWSYITQTTSSGVTINNTVTSNSSITTITGRSILYPIYDNTRTALSVQSMTGIAVEANVFNPGWSIPASTTWGTYTHSVNSDVTSVETLIQQSRPVGVNTLVHQATFVPLALNVSIVYSTGANQSTTNATINNIVSNYLAGVPYLGTISFGALLGQMINVYGVSNIRLNSINIVSPDLSTTIKSYTSDFNLASNQLPVLNTINFTVKGMSNF